MNIFETHSKIVSDYGKYIQSFVNISDTEIKSVVDSELKIGKLWPQPLLQFNPSYEQFGKVEDIAAKRIVHRSIAEIFKGYSLYRHQVEAIALGTSGNDFIVTSGTGSGKSLTYIGTIFQNLLENPTSEGVTAIVVYPMNALINSQTNEFNNYKKNYEKITGNTFPITFGQYTGQEKEEKRQSMREHPPQILLTNYMMLELLLTRIQERSIRDAIYNNLQFLVFDELHTYRGRQGADVAMLIRRIKSQCKKHVSCIGTSATMVSGGSIASQKDEVARVATTMFGRKFSATNVINEYLVRSLSSSGSIDSIALADAIIAGIDTSADESALKNHPVARWLENEIALETRDGDLVRRKPVTIRKVYEKLAEDSGLSLDLCQKCLVDMLLWIGTVNKRVQDSGSKYTILPFRLHQFIAQTGAVYTTLDQGSSRFITLEPGVYKQDDENRKPIYPNVFSRTTGHPFICVSRIGDKLEPREFRESSNEDETVTDGYLIVGDDVWTPEEDMEYLPEAWISRTKRGIGPEKKKKPWFPQKIFFDEFGYCSDSSPMKYEGWFMRAPLLFDPSGGVFFDTKTKEGTKLTKLGSEGRSTSTTITAYSILQQLHEAGYHPRDQKLLSFTDNRQDAALQAGHFNDFIQVVQLRAGIYKALANAPGNVLTYATIGQAIFDALSLPFVDYANRNEESSLAPVRRKFEQIFQVFLFYRAVGDLRRSWRIVLPNLEQCGLLQIQYQDLPEIVATDDFWADMPLLCDLSHKEREEFLTTILDFFRLEYAIHSENFLTPSRIKENEKHFRESLKSPWTLDRNEELREPWVIRYDPLAKSARLFSKSMGPASALGKFIKQTAKFHDIIIDLRGEQYRDFISLLMEKLKDADYLVRDVARGEQNQDVYVYRLDITKIIWKLGDGLSVKADVIKRRSYKSYQPRPNEFFRDMYCRDFSRAKRLRAEDHTGQLGTETRQEREDRFRADWVNDQGLPDDSRIRRESISALFCSPTMELGIDIGGLSVVHMRNAPPNAANYAQRSGRAGRSGQGALVFTYCSSYSAHDRHCFQNQADIVAGVVSAPRLDLCNRELLLTHLNALAISQVGLPGLDSSNGIRPSLMRLIDDSLDDMPLHLEVRAGLKISATTHTILKSIFQRVLQDFENDLQKQAAAWYSDTWIDKSIDSIADNLDASLIRWRRLYKTARALLTRATQPIESGRLKVGSDEYRKFKREQDQANRQLNLLRNDLSSTNELSEFYPYRYLASEGFLPGYNFTRLPIRIFIPSGGGSSGEFISRPRSIALREFGPLNIIYHNGRKYRVEQMVLQDVESSLTSATVCTKSGYYIFGDTPASEFCPFSGVSLADNANKKHISYLLEMTESRAEEIDRITCEEEERVSKGFDVQTYFAVDGEMIDHGRNAAVRSSETTLLQLRYIPSARLVHVNSKWRTQQIEGFPLGMTSGDWRSSMPEATANYKESFSIVKLWTSTTADALYIVPVQGLGLSSEGVITLQYALKRAIEQHFLVEPNEIGVVTMGDPEAPNILLYEAAEGSLGILSRFVEEVDTLSKIISTAKDICRYNDSDYLAPASYDDLLSYYNQRDHLKINRFLIQDALEKLAICSVELQTNTGFRNYDEQYQYMLRNLDPNSSTERVFIDYLYKNGLRLPDAAQKRLDGIYCQPDFYYEPRFWVFCDGSPHDDPAVMAKDESQRQLIIAKGDEVWAWHYKENLADKIAKRSDVFRKVR